MAEEKKLRVSIQFTDLEHRRIKAAAALNGETLQDVGYRLLLNYWRHTQQAMPTYHERQEEAGDALRDALEPQP